MYDPAISRWQVLDNLSDKYYSLSPYNYVANNPLKYIDPDGNDIVIAGKNESSVTIKTDIVDISVNAGSFIGDIGGNYTFEGEDILEAGLDIAGTFDPTGLVDAASAVYYADKGDWGSTIISGVSVLPLGDAAKLLKAKKHLKTINTAIDATKNVQKRKNVSKSFSTRKRMMDARPKPKPAKKGKKRVTRQKRNKKGEGKKMKTDHGSQTEHVHDRNHDDKSKTNVHYRLK